MPRLFDDNDRAVDDGRIRQLELFVRPEYQRLRDEGWNREQATYMLLDAVMMVSLEAALERQMAAIRNPQTPENSGGNDALL